VAVFPRLGTRTGIPLPAVRLELLKLLVPLTDRVVPGAVGVRLDRNDKLNEVVLFLKLRHVHVLDQRIWGCLLIECQDCRAVGVNRGRRRSEGAGKRRVSSGECW